MTAYQQNDCMLSCVTRVVVCFAINLWLQMIHVCKLSIFDLFTYLLVLKML